jgi:RNA-binding protein with serine-rich domain 1
MPSPRRDAGPGVAVAEARAADAAAAAAAPPLPLAKPQRVHIGGLSRNVTAAHLAEIFATYGELLSTELAVDRAFGLPRGYAFVEFLDAAAAAEARAHLDGGQIDGAVVRVEFVSPASPSRRSRTRSRSPARRRSRSQSRRRSSPRGRSPARRGRSPPRRRRRSYSTSSGSSRSSSFSSRSRSRSRGRRN